MRYSLSSVIPKITFVAVLLIHPIEWSLADERESGAATGCGTAEVRVNGTEFRDAFSIDYRIVFDDPDETYCLPADIYKYGEVADAAVLELRPETAPWADTEELSQPIFFARNPGSELFGPQALPSTQVVSVPYRAREYLVPEGRYRLVLRYRRAPCDGAKAKEVCIAASQVFELTSSVTFLPTYCGPEVGDPEAGGDAE